MQSVSSPVTTAKDNRFLGNEGNLKMWALPHDERVLARAIAMTGFSVTSDSTECNMQQINLELADHKQETLQRITLAIGVATWYFSPIKFQADMGILLTVMFLWNMLGALPLLPALACLLNKDKTTASAITSELPPTA